MKTQERIRFLTHQSQCSNGAHSWAHECLLNIFPERMEEKREWRLGGKELRKAGREEDRERKRPLTDSIVLLPRMIQYLKKISLQKCTEYSWTIFALDLKLITSFPNCKSIHFNPLFPSFSGPGAARAGIWAIEGEEDPLVTMSNSSASVELLETITHSRPWSATRAFNEWMFAMICCWV